jgi:hypothetical protein
MIDSAGRVPAFSKYKQVFRKAEERIISVTKSCEEF